VSVLSFNQIGLVWDPLLLCVHNLVFKLVRLLNDVVLFGLHRSTVFIIATFFSKLCPNSVQFVNFELLLVDNIVSLFNRLLKLIDFFFSVFELKDQVVELLLEQIILLLTVEVINANTRDFVWKVFNVDFFEGNILIDLLGLLEQISTTFFNSFLLRSVVNNVISDFLCFRMKRHYWFFQNISLLFNIVLLWVHLISLVLSLRDRVLEHHELFTKSFSLILDVLRSLI